MTATGDDPEVPAEGMAVAAANPAARSAAGRARREGPATGADAPTAAQVVERLGLRPHPEGGWYAETWRHDPGPGRRAAGTAIYYMLEAGQRSHWHRVDATEIWHHYAGDPLLLRISDGDAPTRDVLVGPDLAGGQVPQAIVPEGAWQAAEPTGAWVLVGCTVSPGFRFEGFELAPPGWTPPR